MNCPEKNDAQRVLARPALSAFFWPQFQGYVGCHFSIALAGGVGRRNFLIWTFHLTLRKCTTIDHSEHKVTKRCTNFVHKTSGMKCGLGKKGDAMVMRPFYQAIIKILFKTRIFLALMRGVCLAKC